MTSKPIDLAGLIDPQELLESGGYPWTFLAFPRDIVNRDGVPDDLEAQAYIAAVQSQGIPVGIWIDTPVEDVSYAFVGPQHIRTLTKVLDSLRDLGRFSAGYAEKLTNRLLGIAEHNQ